MIHLLFLFITVAQAQDPTLEAKPLYELGIGGGGGYLPDYPSSDESRWRGVPFPYFIYRGKIFRSDQRKGTRARFFNGENWEVDLSGAGSFPASSKDNLARKGMPDLDWLGEFGPRFIYELNTSKADQRLSVRFPLRWVMSTDLRDIVHQGYSFAPELMWELFNLWHANSRLAIGLTANFIDTKLASYFYSVDSSFATAERNAFAANGGYAGSEITVSFSHPIVKGLRSVSRFTLENYNGTANANSPLHRTDWSTSLSFGIIWVFVESQQLADENQ